MASSHPRFSLPTELDLPDSDGQPVDNELQLLLPALLRAVLSVIWAERSDWFLGVNMGLYHDPDLPAIVPDAFLSLGVPRHRAERPLRLSYVLWQEQVVPQFVLEIVSKQPGGEYGKKLDTYAAIGVLYYAIYNPDYGRRDKHEGFELYRLENGQYMRQAGEPIWMPEVGLGLGRAAGVHEGLEREWLYWYDATGQRYPAPNDVIVQERGLRLEMEQRWLEQQQARQAAERVAEQEQQARQAAERVAEQEQQARQAAEQQLQELLERLRQQGIDPNG
jgi:Uma2 family endonuclease